MSDGQGQLDTRALEKSVKNESDLDNHEIICALRYQGINNALDENREQIKGLYNRQWLTAGAVIVALLGATAWQYQQAQQSRDMFEKTVREAMRVDHK